MRFARLLPWFLLLGCPEASQDPPAEVCVVAAGEAPDSSPRLGCRADFDALASEPLDASIARATSVKTVIDLKDGKALYFQNSKKYAIHWEFASAHLSGLGKPPVPPLADFNAAEYYSPGRRFLLGAVTYYAGAGVWAYEIAPYDTASAEMIASAIEVIRAGAYFGPILAFHPTSQAVEVEAKKLPASIALVDTGTLLGGNDFQPLNLGTSIGRLRFKAAATLEAEPPNFRDIVVLDHVPNDIAVVAGIITAEYQTPLSHINVLSQNRKTPNMMLLGADTDPILKALEDKWVELTVGPFDWSVREATQTEADAWWESHKPEKVAVPSLDLTVTDLRDLGKVLDLEHLSLGDALKKAIPAFGGKASHFSAFDSMDPAKVPHRKAFAVPVYYYRQFMEQNGFDAQVATMMADPTFQGDPKVRDTKLAALRDAMELGTIDAGFLAALDAKIAAEYPGVPMRFRSSTNAEDLGGFTGAGLYTSKTGDPGDPTKPVVDAIRKVWASVWRYKAFEERSYRGIDHTAVGMALLCAPSFPDEEANGVALTANLFDTSGLEPGFWVNVQKGGESVVLPDAGVTTDSFIHYFGMPGEPVTYLSHSSLIPPGETVLTATQIHTLGVALAEIHAFFAPVYGGAKFYAMDVEFKFDGPTGEPSTLFIKQARPHPGWGL